MRKNSLFPLDLLFFSLSLSPTDRKGDSLNTKFHLPHNVPVVFVQDVCLVHAPIRLHDKREYLKQIREGAGRGGVIYA